MFCYQCEQTAKGEGCTKIGVCGKQPDVADLQDLLVYALKGLSLYAAEARKSGIVVPKANAFTCEALFSTLTNVNFDPKRIESYIRRAVELRDELKKKAGAAGIKMEFSHPCASYQPASTMEELLAQAPRASLKNPSANPDLLSLQHILLFGLKGIYAYADHAHILGQEDDAVYAFIHEALATLAGKELPVNEWIGLVLKCGGVNLRAM